MAAQNRSAARLATPTLACRQLQLAAATELSPWVCWKQWPRLGTHKAHCSGAGGRWLSPWHRCWSNMSPRMTSSVIQAEGQGLQSTY